MIRHIPADVEERLKARLADGAYQNEGEILRDAVDALDQVEQEKVTRWHQRNRLASNEIAQGLSKPLDNAKVLARLRASLAREGILS